MSDHNVLNIAAARRQCNRPRREAGKKNAGNVPGVCDLDWKVGEKSYFLYSELWMTFHSPSIFFRYALSGFPF